MAKDYDIAKKTVQDEMKTILEGMNTTLSGTLTANVVKKVQRGRTQMSNATVNVTIEAVNLEKAFVNLAGGGCVYKDDLAEHAQSSARLVNETTLKLYVYSGNSNYYLNWEVIEFY